MRGPLRGGHRPFIGGAACAASETFLRGAAAPFPGHARLESRNPSGAKRCEAD